MERWIALIQYIKVFSWNCGALNFKPMLSNVIIPRTVCSLPYMNTCACPWLCSWDIVLQLQSPWVAWKQCQSINLNRRGRFFFFIKKRLKKIHLANYVWAIENKIPTRQKIIRLRILRVKITLFWQFLLSLVYGKMYKCTIRFRSFA